MSFCDVCRSIDFPNIPKLPDHYEGYSNPWENLLVFHSRLRGIAARKAGDENAGDFSQPLGAPHHQSLDELKSAAERCSICSVILRGVSQCVAALADAGKDEVYAYYQQKEEPRYKHPEWTFWIAKRRDCGDGFMVMSPGSGRMQAWLVAAVGFCVEDDDPLSSIIPGRIVQQDAGSEKTLAIALNWIKECDTQHTSPKCRAQDEELPKRVLDLEYDGSTSRIALYETNGELGKYNALSHVWGKHRQFMTTQSTIEAHKRGIILEDLPKTFQDAVTITRKMRVRYLWIDSIAICQDDGPDWERESAKMASIYANAYLVLAATGSSSDAEGFFIQRSTPQYSPFKYEVNNIQGVVHAFLLTKDDVAHSGAACSLDEDPLCKRGWALQERFLARRTLHSGSKQMYFECFEQFSSEDGSRGTPLYNDLSEVTSGTTKQTELTTYRGDWRWHSLTQEYGGRNLTNASDKLPAISGIARSFQERTGDQYLAGLWRSQLMEDLIWQAIGSFNDGTKAPQQYRAPSWSWASIDGHFGNLGIGQDFMDEEAYFVDVATIKDCHVELKGENPYGEVKSGYITLRGPLEALTPSEEKEHDWETVPHKRVLRMKTPNGAPFGARCMFDSISEETALGLRLSVLILVRRKTVKDEPEDRTYQGLILAPVEGQQQTYRRVGKMILDHEDLGICDWMEDDSKMIDLTII